MRAKLLLLWLTAATLYAAPRDPFQPLASSLCDTPAALTGWRLQGVLGRLPSLRAWLVSPQGAIVKIAPAQRFPLSGWRLRAIAPRSLTLMTRSGCAPQILTLSLKGSAYAQDDTSSAGVPLARARAGR